VDEDDERLVGYVGERRTDGLGARGSSGDTRDDLGRRKLLGEKDGRLLPAWRSGNDDRIDPRTAVEPIQTLGEERPPCENGERLGAVDSEPLSRPGGDQQRPGGSSRAGNV